MATIKSYTDLEQSKKLAEILQQESSDMYYINGDVGKISIGEWENNVHDEDDLPCWSLASLLDIVKTYSSRLEIALRADKNYNIFAVSGNFVFRSFDECSEGYSNPIDAAYELILKLNELKIKKND